MCQAERGSSFAAPLRISRGLHLRFQCPNSCVSAPHQTNTAHKYPGQWLLYGQGHCGLSKLCHRDASRYTRLSSEWPACPSTIRVLKPSSCRRNPLQLEFAKAFRSCQCILWLEEVGKSHCHCLTSQLRVKSWREEQHSFVGPT